MDQVQTGFEEAPPVGPPVGAPAGAPVGVPVVVPAGAPVGGSVVIPAGAPVTPIPERPKDSPPKPRGKKRKTKVLRDVTAPRQPLTGYVRYLNERRETLRAGNPRLGFAEVTRRLASEWGQLPAEEKQQYLDAAEQDRERYIREWSAYKETDAYRTFRQQQLERKEAAGPGVSSNKKARTISQNKTSADKSGESSINVNGNANISMQITTGTNSTPITNRPKAVGTPLTTAINRTDGCHPEVDIPIFTEQFLQHNKLRETELRQLRKANTDYEQQNAILQKHIENMRGVVDKTKNETAAQVARTTALHSHLNFLVERLVSLFGTVSLPGGPTGATEQNIEQYMESLKTMAAENKNNPTVKQARELLSKIDIAV